MSHIPIAGELVVVALKAENLQHQSHMKQAPFCVFRVGDIIKRTKADPAGGLNPVWDDQVNIPIVQGQRQLMVQIFNRDTNLQNLMAEGHIDLSEVFKNKEFDGFFPLIYRGRPGFGEICLELTYYPANVNAIPMPQQQQQIRNNYLPQDHSGYRPQPQRPHPQPQYGPSPVQPFRPLPIPPTQHAIPPRPQRPPHPMAYPVPRPSSSMGTQQPYPPPPMQPLLSAPYNPVLSPIRPPGQYNEVPYPPNHYPPTNYPATSYSTPHYPTQPAYPAYPQPPRPMCPPNSHYNRPPTYPPY